MSIYNILAKLSALTAGENSTELNKTGATTATANDTLTEAAAELEKKFRDWEPEDEHRKPTATELETDKELKVKGKETAKTLQKISLYLVVLFFTGLWFALFSKDIPSQSLLFIFTAFAGKTIEN